MTQKPIDWAREHAATIEDAPSLRTMYRFAKENLAENERIRGLMREAGREHLLDWNRCVGTEDADNREAKRLCRAGLKRLGAPL